MPSLISQKFIAKILRLFAESVSDRVLEKETVRMKSSNEIKVAQRHLFNYYQEAIKNGTRWNLSDTGFRNYSQFEEDGILLYIFAAIGTTNRIFVDIGSGDGINSNCANLAINFGWDGLFIDGSEKNIARGRVYYEGHKDTWAYPPRFLKAFIQRENINELIQSQGITGEVDLVSIDLDGNDYWIWDALTIIAPRVVIIETQSVFGDQSIVIPYDKDFSYQSKQPHYFGASRIAMTKLASIKGYRLVGANTYGFNLIYLKQGLAEDILPEVTVESIVKHQRNAEQFKLFESIKNLAYIQV